MKTAAPIFFLLVGLANAASLNQGIKVKISPVQKVVQMIDEMAGKVQKELDATTKDFEEYAKFCDDESVAKDYAIKDGKESMEELGATITDTSAGIESAAAKIEDLSTKISDTESELSTATALRKKENEEFVKKEAELLETTRELEGATTSIKKSLSLVQLRGGKVGQSEREALNALLAGLGQLVEASFIKPEQRRHIQSFLEERADAEEAFEARARTLDSNAIVDTLTTMTDEAEESLTTTRKREGEAGHGFAMLKQSLEGETAGMKEELSESTQFKASSAEKLATAQQDLVVTTKSFEEDTAYLKDLKRDCQTRAREFEVTVKDNNAELTALGKAKAILLKKFALVQTHTQVRALAKVRVQDEDPKSRALRSIEQLGRKLHSTALVSLAYRAASDPFGKVRSMIEDMIAKLLQEAAEEATQKAFCDKEIGESTASKDEKQGKLDKVNSRLEKAESTIATLTEQVTVLSKEVADTDAALAEATALRAKEKATFTAVEKDLSESQEACAAATEVLREYYEGASLIQTGQKAKDQADEQGDGSGILGMLEVAESDFATSLAEARTVEGTAQAEFDKMKAEAKMLKATKTMEIKGKQSEIGSLKTSVSDLGTDKEGLTGELDAVLAYLDKLKPQCETKVPSYAERKAAREQEIEGLKNALEILEQ
jgi:chromosome segregation ATPase